MPQDESGRVILVLDDEEDLARIGAQLAEMCGYKGIYCTSVAEAKSLIKECDLLFTDVAMEGPTGLDLIKWIHAEGNDIPIVATSGAPEPLEMAQRIGANVCIPKPWELEVLKRTFSELLE